MRLLVSGAAGFLGSHLAARLLRDGHEIVGVDNLGSAYICHPQNNGGLSLAYPAHDEPVTVNEAMRFDGRASHERLIALCCPQPFALSGVEETLRHIGRTLAANVPAPLLLEGCTQQETVLTKVPRTDSGAKSTATQPRPQPGRELQPQQPVDPSVTP